MVELFKTNVQNEAAAAGVLRDLRSKFKGHRFNFDLKDRDRLLRVECASGELEIDEILSILCAFQIKADILEDTVFPPAATFLASVLLDD